MCSNFTSDLLLVVNVKMFIGQMCIAVHGKGGINNNEWNGDHPSSVIGMVPYYIALEK